MGGDPGPRFPAYPGGCPHTEAFTHRRLYTQKLLHRRFLHKRFYTQKLLHTDTFTHRNFYTQTLLHTDTLTHSTQKLLSRRVYTDAFTHRSLHTQHAEALYTQKKIAILLLPQFLAIDPHFVRNMGCRSNLISCERVARDDLNSHFSPSF